jgi:hypothetical protein
MNATIAATSPWINGVKGKIFKNLTVTFTRHEAVSVSELVSLFSP